MAQKQPAGDQIRPHIPYHWESYRFTPRLIAPGDDETWLIDSMLPLLARIDRASGEIEGPIPVAAPEEHGRDAHALAFAEGSLWIRFGGGVSRYVPSSGVDDLIQVQGVGIAAGAEGAWTITGTSELGRLDRGEVEATGLGLQERVHTNQLCVGHGLVYTCAWDLREEGHWRSILTSLDPGTGEVNQRMELAGSPQSLTVSGNAVWLFVWREGAGSIESVLVQIDPVSLGVLGELEVRPVGVRAAILDEELWTDSRDPYDADSEYSPSSLRRMDPRTGEVHDEISLDGPIDWLVAGPDAVWACFGSASGDSGVIEIGPGMEVPRLYDPRPLDISAHLPPRPGQIDAEEMERDILQKVARPLLDGLTRTDQRTGAKQQVPFTRGIDFEEVRLEGSFPDTEVVALFRFEGEAQVFGRRWRVWGDDGAIVADPTVWITNLDEDLLHGPGLRAKHAPDANGIIWT